MAQHALRALALTSPNISLLTYTSAHHRFTLSLSVSHFALHYTDLVLRTLPLLQMKSSLEKAKFLSAVTTQINPLSTPSLPSLFAPLLNLYNRIHNPLVHLSFKRRSHCRLLPRLRLVISHDVFARACQSKKHVVSFGLVLLHRSQSHFRYAIHWPCGLTILLYHRFLHLRMTSAFGNTTMHCPPCIPHVQSGS